MVVQSSAPIRYAIVDGMNVRDSRDHNYARRWNAQSSDRRSVARTSQPHVDLAAGKACLGSCYGVRGVPELPHLASGEGKGVEVKQGALVQRGIKRALAYGALATLDGRPRPGKEPTTTAD